MARSRHGQLVSTQETADLLDADKDLRSTGLAAPYNRPFTLGTTRMELFRSGYGFGAASARIEIDETSYVYAGRIQPRGSLLGGDTDIRTCDILVISARYAHLTLPDSAEIVGDLLAHCKSVMGQGGTAVLVVRSFLQGLEIASLLGQHTQIPVRGHFSLMDALRRCGHHESLPIVRPVNRDEMKEPHVLIWPMNRRDKLDTLDLPNASSIALVSGTAKEPGELARARVDVGFPWSDEADGPALRKYIEATCARQVFWMDAGDQAPFTHLKGLPMTRRVGPPIQMNLFSSLPARRQSDRIA